MKNNLLEKLQLKQLTPYLKPRPREAHKGLYGHVLVVGGDYGFSGAVRLAAEAALRVGAGLVSVATRPEHALTLNAVRPEIMCHGIDSEKDLNPRLEKATVIVVGPGIGSSSWAKNLLVAVMQSNKPLIVDADALNILAAGEIKAPESVNWILTPHPGEAGRLLEKTSLEIQSDRLQAVKELQKKWGGICVLKGADSLILAAKGLPAVCSSGNPGMATAGMGDVLSGVLAGLAAQGIPLLVAAKLGVLLHAEAGDLAAKAGGERGMIASDLFPYLRQLVNDRALK